MKRIVLPVVALFLCSLAYSQTTSMGMQTGPVVQFGIKLGGGLADFDDDVNFDNQKPRGSIVGGIYTEIDLTERIAIQPELLFSAQGAESKTDNMQIELDYINLPIVGKFFFLGNLYGTAGVQFGYAISKEAELDLGDDGIFDDADNPEYDLSDDNYNSFDMSIPVGLGYSTNIGLEFDFRYNMGVTDVLKNNNNGALRNQVLQLTLGYKF